MKIAVYANRADVYEGQEPYPLIGKPFRGEMGPAGERGWVMRTWALFLFRRAVGVEVWR